MTRRLLCSFGILGSAFLAACGGSVSSGSGGGATTSGNGGGSTSTSSTTGSSTTTGSGTTTGSTTSSGTTTSSTTSGTTTSSTTTGSGSIVYCNDAPMDPNACATGQKCLCGGPGGGIVCECGIICASDADCTNPGQPLCCGGGTGQTGVCTSQCTCLCD